MTIRRIEVYCDHARHQRRNNDNQLGVSEITAFVHTSIEPNKPIPRRGQEPPERIYTWREEPGATTERQKRQRNWEPPKDAPKDEPDQPLSFDALMAAAGPGNDRKLSTTAMVDARTDAARPLTTFGPPKGNDQKVEPKVERTCPSCPRRINRYLYDLMPVFDAYAAAGESRVTLAFLERSLDRLAARKSI